MKNKFLFIIALIIWSVYFGQVGINTTEPKATLDVVGSPTTLTAFDGILPPRITGDQLKLKTYTTSQIGVMVYVTDADSSPTGQTINVNSLGYYYFSPALVWVKLGSGGELDTTNDAWINNPTDTRVELGKRSDGITARSYNTDFVIKDDGKVGIGITSPVSGLHLMGDADAAKEDLRISSYNSNPGAALIFEGSRGTFASPANVVNGDILGQIGMNGRVNGANSLLSGIYSSYKGSGTTNLSDLYFVTSGSATPAMIINESGNIGVNTVSPSAKMEINSGTANVSGLEFTQINSATPTAGGQPLGVDNLGKVITLDTPAIGTIYTSLLSTDATNNTTTYQSTPLSVNVPIGVWSVEALVRYNSYYTNDAKFRFTQGAGSAMTGTALVLGAIIEESSPNNYAQSINMRPINLFSGDLEANGSGNLGPTDMYAKIEGILYVTAAGIFTLNYAKNTNIDLIYTNMTIRSGTYMKLTRLN